VGGGGNGEIIKSIIGLSAELIEGRINNEIYMVKEGGDLGYWWSVEWWSIYILRVRLLSSVGE
jgi:hypothetical protein